MGLRWASITDFNARRANFADVMDAVGGDGYHLTDGYVLGKLHNYEVMDCNEEDTFERKWKLVICEDTTTTVAPTATPDHHDPDADGCDFKDVVCKSDVSSCRCSYTQHKLSERFRTGNYEDCLSMGEKYVDEVSMKNIVRKCCTVRSGMMSWLI